MGQRRDIGHKLTGHLLETHSIPRFDGKQSRRHEDVAMWRLQLRGARRAIENRRQLEQVKTLVQFAGFPRSGHSLVGSLIDAHPSARVAHELDIMGLLARRMPMTSILALIDEAAQMFTRNGRHWNGYCYYVDGAGHDSALPPTVLGDKKGDMAVRRVADQPALMGRLNRHAGLARKWICVMRNPFDNIATMSLRASREYDRLRAESASGEEFSHMLGAAQARGDLPREPLTREIDEYERLCRAVEQIQNKTSASDWFELSHESFSLAPAESIEAVYSFLDLDSDAEQIQRAASLVHKSTNKSRDRLSWSRENIDRVNALIRRYSFLHRYADAA
tara:strand:+ start:313 stop:1314 length:1002 start_codon:yes stop_codon:yes gene_type:complete